MLYRFRGSVESSTGWLYEPRRLFFGKTLYYGSSYWGDYERLLNVKQWHASGTFRFGKEETLSVGVVLARHFSDREFNSDEQLAQLFTIVNAALKLSVITRDVSTSQNVFKTCCNSSMKAR